MTYNVRTTSSGLRNIDPVPILEAAPHPKQSLKAARKEPRWQGY